MQNRWNAFLNGKLQKFKDYTFSSLGKRVIMHADSPRVLRLHSWKPAAELQTTAEPLSVSIENPTNCQLKHWSSSGNIHWIFSHWDLSIL